jgi:hypothetical protein
MENVIKRPGAIEELERVAFHIPTSGIEVEYSSQDKGAWIPKYPEKVVYGVNNSVVAWVAGSGSVAACPYFRGLIPILKRQGYQDRGIYVPFSNGDIPADARLAKQWSSLYFEVRALNWEDARMDARNACDAGDIPDEILVGLREIPPEGVEYIFPSSKNTGTIFPAMSSPCVDCVVLPRLGLYNTNNGKIIVNANDGRTYFGRLDSNIIQVLESLGYERRHAFVPFSNGEQIIEEE